MSGISKLYQKKTSSKGRILSLELFKAFKINPELKWGRSLAGIKYLRADILTLVTLMNNFLLSDASWQIKVALVCVRPNYTPIKR